MKKSFLRNIAAVIILLSPLKSLADADVLLNAALQQKISDAQVIEAAALLDSQDPFERGLGWWAIAIKVGMDNEGFEVVWPAGNPPDWYKKWAAVPDDFHIEADYVRQTANWGLHQKADQLLDAAARVLKQTESLAADIGKKDNLQVLHEIYRELSQQVKSSASLIDCRKTYIRFRSAAREIILSNPDIDFNNIVFVTQYQAHTKRNITRSFPWKHKPGGDICILSDFRKEQKVRPVINGQLGQGFVWGLDLWWDADRMVFSYAKQKDWPPKLEGSLTDRHHELRNLMEPLHIYEIQADGTGLRQITEHDVWNDFEPAYCPNGDIVFPSDRKGNAAQCGPYPYDVSNPNLYICNGGGGNIRRLTDFKDLDRYPHCLDNGLMSFTRWEYQERHFMETHAIWTIRPDGTMVDNCFGHHLASPLSVRDARSIPGSSKLVAIAAGHHTFAHGPVIVIDNNQGLNSSRAISIVTPNVKPQEGGMSGDTVQEGGVQDKGLFRQPYALSEKAFLVSFAYDQLVHKIEPSQSRARALSNGFGIYYIDVWGNKELIYRHPVLSCANPIPFKKRNMPPILPDMVDNSLNYALCSTVDVYEGVEDIERGRIKYIRIAQHVPWPLSAKYGMMPYFPKAAYSPEIGYSSWSPVRIIGTVPVEDDGSAYFKVPVDLAVYFQALDENFMELQRMRAIVAFKPGEVRSCTGCHETRTRAPSMPVAKSKALQRDPSQPVPPAWGDEKNLGYEWLIQPILDKRCIKCHSGPKPKAGLDFSADKDGTELCRSYRTMIPAECFKHSGKTTITTPLLSLSNRFSNSDVTKPMEFGSHKSKLTLKLLKDRKHREKSGLTDEEWRAIITWVDANAPYFDTYFNKRPDDGNEPIRVEVKLDPPFGEAGVRP